MEVGGKTPPPRRLTQLHATGPLQLGQTAMVVGQRLLLHVLLLGQLPLGVDEPQKIQLAADVIGLRRLQIMLGGRQDPSTI